jgi:hypothetical protein
LLDELSVTEDSRVMRFQASSPRRGRGFYNSRSSSPNPRSSSPMGGYSRSSSPAGRRSCCLCQANNRPGYDNHFLSQCRYLPEGDRRRFSSSPRVRAVDVQDNDDEEYLENYEDHHQNYASNSNFTSGYAMHNPNMDYDPMYDESEQYSQYRSIRRVPSQVLPISRRVTTRKSPRMQCFYRHNPVCLLLDTGAESNLISESTASSLDLQISNTKQGALQADETTPLNIVGEVKEVQLNKGPHVFILDALVVKSAMTDIVAGEPFLELNDIAVRPAKHLITVKGKDSFPYEPSL